MISTDAAKTFGRWLLQGLGRCVQSGAARTRAQLQSQRCDSGTFITAMPVTSSVDRVRTLPTHTAVLRFTGEVLRPGLGTQQTYTAVAVMGTQQKGPIMIKDMHATSILLSRISICHYK